MDATAVTTFYDETQTAFDAVWMDSDNLAMHYGYWDDRVRDHHQSLIRMNEVLADAAATGGQDVVLDAGCGVGGSSLWLARERGAEVVGVTLLPRQVQRAQAEATRRGLAHRVRFEVRDFHATGYPDRSFSLVWALESVCHSGDKAAFLREAHRLLRSGGRLVMADFFRVRPSQSLEVEHPYQEMLQGWAMPDLFTPATFRDRATAAGFGSVTLTDITQYVRRSAWRIFALAGQISVAAKLPTGHGDPGLAACRGQLLALEAGLWGYMVAVARK